MAKVPMKKGQAMHKKNNVVIFSLWIIVQLLIVGTNCQGAPDWPLEVSIQCRPGTYWWAPGSAFDHASIDWNLEQLKAGGIGTVHIIPIYGAKGYEDQYIQYLSPEWMAMLDYVVKKAEQMDMLVDMTTGTGWCFGGPDLPPAYRDTVVRWQGVEKGIAYAAGMNVKRPAPGGEGPMLNPYSPDAMQYYLQRFTSAFEQSGSRKPRAQYHDSFEYKGDWTMDMLEQFKRRRGYDLERHLVTFFGSTTDTNRDMKARMKYDYRRTISDLHLESIELWTQWAHEQGMITRNEAHGSPSQLLDVYAAADIPETEMFGAPEFEVAGFRRDPQFCRAGDSNPLVMKMASSAAHVAHRPGAQLVGSESFTWLREHWHGTLGQIKLSSDLFFLAGINHLLYHGSCYSAKDAAWPGWFFYASTKADWRNSIWHDIQYLNDYITRCQSMLQAGEPGNDLLVYWPIHDYWMNAEGMAQKMTVHGDGWITGQSLGRFGIMLQEEGYSFDFVSDRMLETLTFSDGRIQAVGGWYRAIVIPACQYMPAETMEQLAKLANDGATVIFEEALPGDVPGLDGLAQQRAQFAAGKSAIQSKAIISKTVCETLAESGIMAEPMIKAGLHCIRRRIDGDTWYFIANHSADTFDQWIGLANPVKSVICYDPMTGQSGALAVRQRNRQSQVYLQLESGESTLIRGSNSKVTVAGWKYRQTAGQPVTLAGNWKIEFVEGGPTLPQTYHSESLVSWTEADDPATDAFAGTARYTLSFEMPATRADDWMLDLGDVRESARIRVNSQDAGALVALPFRMPIGKLLHPGTNTLEVEVTNLTANRIRALEKSGADWKIMRDANIVNVNYQKFDPASWPLELSGLLGPVQLVPAQYHQP